MLYGNYTAPIIKALVFMDDYVNPADTLIDLDGDLVNVISADRGKWNIPVDGKPLECPDCFRSVILLFSLSLPLLHHEDVLPDSLRTRVVLNVTSRVSILTTVLSNVYCVDTGGFFLNFCSTRTPFGRLRL